MTTTTGRAGGRRGATITKRMIRRGEIDIGSGRGRASPPWVWVVAASVEARCCCWAAAAWGASSAGSCWRGSGPVSVNNYNQLHKGMSPAQVQNILGPPTTSSAIFNIQVMTWQNGSDFITVQYQNGSAVARSCNIQHNGWVQMQDSGLLPW